LPLCYLWQGIRLPDVLSSRKYDRIKKGATMNTEKYKVTVIATRKFKNVTLKKFYRKGQVINKIMSEKRMYWFLLQMTNEEYRAEQPYRLVSVESVSI
jgi:hypothetical protein